MQQFYHPIKNRQLFEQQLLLHFKSKKNIVFLNSNHPKKENFIAISNSNIVDEKAWQFGFISYDYKNQLEQLQSTHFDGIKFPEKHFFSPEILFKLSLKKVEISYNEAFFSELEIEKMVLKIEAISIKEDKPQSIKVLPKITKEDYLNNVEHLKNHIQLGDIYEVNYCQEYYAKEVEINPINLYLALNKKSPTPLSCFVKHNDTYLMSATPERFIQKTKTQLVSQPIKGTIKRGENEVEDMQLKQQLLQDEKERSENIMIVDLVRNDFSKIANKGSVKVDELCQVYTFPQVHQLISTVSAKVDNSITFEAIIKATFPMGSMTGAPKIRAMELIEQYEKTKRGLYAGTVGYINPNGDFDFNVVIRSLQYNQKNQYLSFMVGGAITSLSDAEKEYEECLLKAKAMIEVLENKC